MGPGQSWRERPQAYYATWCAARTGRPGRGAVGLIFCLLRSKTSVLNGRIAGGRFLQPGGAAPRREDSAPVGDGPCEGGRVAHTLIHETLYSPAAVWYHLTLDTGAALGPTGRAPHADTAPIHPEGNAEDPRAGPGIGDGRGRVRDGPAGAGALRSGSVHVGPVHGALDAEGSLLRAAAGGGAGGNAGLRSPGRPERSHGLSRERHPHLESLLADDRPGGGDVGRRVLPCGLASAGAWPWPTSSGCSSRGSHRRGESASRKPVSR